MIPFFSSLLALRGGQLCGTALLTLCVKVLGGDSDDPLNH